MNLKEKLEKTGDKVAIKATRVMTSWLWVFCVMTFNSSYDLYNTFSRHPFDPPPFMGQNLILSLIAAVTPSFVMMSTRIEVNSSRIREDANFAIDESTLKIAKESKELLRHLEQRIKDMEESLDEIP